MDLITFTHQIAMSLHRVGLAGAAVDMKLFHELGKQWQQDAAKMKDKVTKFALKQGMEQFSPTNDAHIRELLYDRLGLPVYNKTKGGEDAVDKATLKRILINEEDAPLDQDGLSFIKDLMVFNQTDKLASTWYGKPEADTAHQRGRKNISVSSLIQPYHGAAHGSDLGLLHFWIFPLRARTGRRASGGSEEGDPQSRNSQNWPPAARRVIRSRFPRGKIAVCDFSRLEVVLVAWCAQDEKLLDYFLNGNGYIGVAKEFWGEDVADGTPKYKAVKALVLGLSYGMGYFHLANDLWFKTGFKFSDDFEEHVRLTKRARKKYLHIFYKLARYQRQRVHEVAKTQKVVSATGRVRHLPHHGSDSEGFWHMRNAAMHFPIQSLASDVTGGAIVDYEEALLREHGLSYNDWHSALLDHPGDVPCSPVFNEVHDELDLDLHPKTGKRDVEILVDCMRNCRTLKKLVPDFDIKLKVDVQTVKSWGDAK